MPRDTRKAIIFEPILISSMLIYVQYIDRASSSSTSSYSATPTKLQGVHMIVAQAFASRNANNVESPLVHLDDPNFRIFVRTLVISNNEKSGHYLERIHSDVGPHS
jgi:hypothetical protein